MKLTRSSFFFFIVLLIAWNHPCNAEKVSPYQPKVEQGKIDLTGWDFNRDGVVNLAGEWEFFWDRFLYPVMSAERSTTDKPGYLKVPGDWTQFKVVDENIGKTGYASYRLSIHLGERDQSLALKIDMIRTAHQVYLNGKYAGAVGNPGLSKESTVPMNYPVIIDLPNSEQEVELVIQVSNFHHQTAGIRGEIRLGLESDIRNKRAKKLLIEVLIAGCLLVMGIYHFILFGLRRRDRAPLYFGLLCLLQCVFTLQRGERYFFHLFESIGWELITRGGFFSHILTIFCFLLFIHWLFDQSFPQRVIQVYKAICGVFLLLGAFVPLTSYTTIGSLLDLFTAIVAIHIIYFLFRLYLQRTLGSGVFLFAILVIFLTLMNDILVSNWVIQSPLVFPYGFLFFVFCQAYLLSVRFNNAFVSVENLTGELKLKSDQLERSNQELSDLNQNLETRVADRTCELSKANQDLQKEIEERRVIEDMLRESEQSFRSLADQTFMGIVIAQDQTVVYANKATAEIIDYPPEEIVDYLGSELPKYAHVDDLEEAQRKAEILEVGGDVAQMPIRLKTRKGEIKWVETYLKSILYNGKKATLVTLIDVTERRENEARLESLRRELVDSAHRAGMADIAANTLHNVGNILNSVKTSVFFMEREIGQNPQEGLSKANEFFKMQLESFGALSEERSLFLKVAEYYMLLEQDFSTQYRNVKEELSRMSGMVDSLSRVILMQQAYATGDAFEEILDPVILVEEAINIQKDALSMHQVKIVKNFQDVPLIPLQKTKLLYILTNLILNSIQAMEETPVEQRELEFITESRDQSVLISIRDSGCGIEKDDLEKVFSFGFSTKENSHGYGLHSCANYMNEMKGKINVLSSGKNKGAMFELFFPQ